MFRLLRCDNCIYSTIELNARFTSQRKRVSHRRTKTGRVTVLSTYYPLLNVFSSTVNTHQTVAMLLMPPVSRH